MYRKHYNLVILSHFKFFRGDAGQKLCISTFVCFVFGAVINFEGTLFYIIIIFQ